VALKVLKDKSYENEDYQLHYYGMSINGKELRSSTMFIKQNGRPIGMLCINFDDSRYRELSTKLMGLSHPDWFVEDFTTPPVQKKAENAKQLTQVPESFRNSTEAVAADAIAWQLKLLGVTAHRLTTEERVKIIAALDKSGIFLLKGAVRDVAQQLHCSQASVYRYLTQVKNEETE
jgi:predicted transcriptional regulator YheO